MLSSAFRRGLAAFAGLTCLAVLSACTERATVNSLAELDGKEFAVPTGTVADQLVTSKLPSVRFQYYNTVLDAAMAVQAGKADAAAYDEPVLRNIVAKNPGLRVLPEQITVDEYGFAMRLDDQALKEAMDAVIAEARAGGLYQEMMDRWLPTQGTPGAMPTIPDGTEGELVFGTSATTEPFSFMDGSQQIVGMDIEFAARVAQQLNKRLKVVNMDFGAMIPALIAGKVDLIGACITITDERKKAVLFSTPYYTGGISALVKGS
jgi:polar amino acid transport system substrate-binding protein